MKVYLFIYLFIYLLLLLFFYNTGVSSRTHKKGRRKILQNHCSQKKVTARKSENRLPQRSATVGNIIWRHSYCKLCRYFSSRQLSSTTENSLSQSASLSLFSLQSLICFLSLKGDDSVRYINDLVTIQGRNKELGLTYTESMFSSH